MAGDDQGETMMNDEQQRYEHAHAKRHRTFSRFWFTIIGVTLIVAVAMLWAMMFFGAEVATDR
jgi:nitrogen fixation/metabolism regulation signal transduction histidine kinase